MKYYIMVLVMLTCAGARSQVHTYDFYIAEADSLFKIGAFQQSAQAFSHAFKTNKWKGRIDHRYFAGRAWAKAGNPDSAFFQIEKIANSGHYLSSDQLINDPGFKSLHDDNRWTNVVHKLMEAGLKQQAELDKTLAAKLEVVLIQDQKYRITIDSLIKREGVPSAKAQVVLNKMHETDSVNLFIVSEILDKHGWVGPKKIGNKGSLALFLVIQHANLNTQLKYLPLLMTAVSKGDAETVHLAYLHDRVLLQQNKRQIYGTQIGIAESSGQRYILPLSDPLNADKRRAEIGLEPLAEYVAKWNIKWNPDEYERELANLN